MGVILSFVVLLLSVHVSITYPPYNGRSTLAYIVERPYCLIDPSCLNPFGGGANGLTDHGFAGNDFADMNSFTGFALPNYTCFVAVMSAAGYTASRHLRGRIVRQVIVGAVIVWVWLEINRWFSQLTNAPTTDSSVDVLDWFVQHVVLDVATLGTVALAITRGAKRASRSR
jgi:hypothetical protein